MFRTRDDYRHDICEIDRFLFMGSPFASTRKVLAGRGVDNESLEFRSGARHRLRRYDGGAINPVGKFTDGLLAASAHLKAPNSEHAFLKRVFSRWKKLQFTEARNSRFTRSLVLLLHSDTQPKT